MQDGSEKEIGKTAIICNYLFPQTYCRLALLDFIVNGHRKLAEDCFSAEPLRYAAKNVQQCPTMTIDHILCAGQVYQFNMIIVLLKIPQGITIKQCFNVPYSKRFQKLSPYRVASVLAPASVGLA